MSGRFEERLSKVLAGWVGRTQANPRVVVAAMTVLTIIFGLYAARNLGINTDLDAMFSEELPHRVLELEYEKTFPMMAETVLVVIDGETPERASEATDLLAERMRGRPDLFRSVFVPGGPFFEEHALLYMTTEELEDFADHLARVQPYLAGLASQQPELDLPTKVVHAMLASHGLNLPAVGEEDLHPDAGIALSNGVHECVRGLGEPPRVHGDNAEVTSELVGHVEDDHPVHLERGHDGHVVAEGVQPPADHVLWILVIKLQGYLPNLQVVKDHPLQHGAPPA